MVSDLDLVPTGVSVPADLVVPKEITDQRGTNGRSLSAWR